MNRESYITKPASLEEREKIWKNQITSTETHIALGQTLQQQGVEILNALQEQEIGGEQAVLIIQKATQFIQKGVQIEREAQSTLSELLTREPC